MPVNVDKNLTLKNNTMDATYGELFKKLNVAYGWTHTKTTSSGGTAVVLVNDGDILTTMECNDINKCSWGKGHNYGTRMTSIFVIINGKIYRYYSNIFQQYGNKTDYIMVAGEPSNAYAIDESGKLWYITESTESQVGTDTSWTYLSYFRDSYVCGINNGKLYLIYKTDAVQKHNDFTNVTKVYAVKESSNIYGYCLNNNYLYYLSNGVSSLIGDINDWIYASSESGQVATIVGITSNGNLYYISGTNIYKINISNVKKAEIYGSSGICITNDKKLYLLKSLKTQYGDNYGQVYDISNGIEWTDISRLENNHLYFYAIGDEKLYKIKPSSSVSSTIYTQIGVETNYKKVEGIYPGTNDANNIGLAWTGDATTVSHTVYTTKSPQANDATYIDEDLTKYSTIQSVGSTTVTDQYRTYERDVSKDSSFTAIPPETVHETVSTVDFLRITNPNT